MDFREMMGGQKGDDAGRPNAASLVERHQNRQNEFEAIHNKGLELVSTNWELAKNKQPVRFDETVQLAKEMVRFVCKEELGVSFFKKLPDVPYYILNVVNVAWLSIFLAYELGYKEETLVELAVAGLLHDIGLALTTPDILTKTEKLTYDEYQEIRKHPEAGKELLSSIDNITENILRGVLEEHERENGTGYPDGKQGKEIHEFAKIIGLVDVFEAMTHYRDYRETISPNRAILEIIAEKGKLFHDKYVKSFLNVFTFYPVGSYVHLNTNEVGEVIKTDKKYPTRPIIKLLIDKAGDLYVETKLMSLADKNLIYVKETLTETDVNKILKEI